MPKNKINLLDVARQIVDEFTQAELQKGHPFRAEFRDPAIPKRIIQNSVGVRVRLLRQLRNATRRAEASHVA